MLSNQDYFRKQMNGRKKPKGYETLNGPEKVGQECLVPHVGCWSTGSSARNWGSSGLSTLQVMGAEPKSSPWGWICPSEPRSMLGALIYCDLFAESDTVSTPSALP